ncbi:MAG: cellobiose phosphorylase [Bacillota bacterium]
MKPYYFDGPTFVIENYNRQKTFANFLPGVAGKKGIPLWSFYVNRGQGLSGYGLQDKSGVIMEFTPANKAYESVSQIGFRTFFKVNGTPYEAFRIESPHAHSMRVDKASFTIEETNEDLGLKTTITYYGLPNEPIAGLVRNVTIENISDEALELEVLDGIAEILPAGIDNGGFKATSNLLRSWMDVEHLDEQTAYYKLRASTNDSSEVSEKNDGNFYIGYVDGTLTTPIVDQKLVFGYDTSKNAPVNFLNSTIETLTSEEQVTANKVACGFIPIKKTLKKNDTITINALSGHTASYDLLKSMMSAFDAKYFESKKKEASKEVDTLLDDVKTDTAIGPFNEYIKQNYLDNFLRGGYPIEIGDGIYHLYSRRHGDLERDYNYFSLAPEYYSQGAGNFRDVAQNRRMDSLINRNVERFNIQHFASLIQLDGYNPLSVNGTVYVLEDSEVAKTLIEKHFDAHERALEEKLSKPFTPGQLVNFVENNNVSVKTSEAAYLDDLITKATPKINAAFGEGFWSDHFTYVLDLVETFESVYPERMENLMFEDESFLYFESPVSVRPQSEKTVITKDNKIRQYGSLRHFDEEKMERLSLDPNQPNFTKIEGQEYTSTLYVKLLSLVMNKHSLIDPEGLGIEMEANKPGWNDAMNGVPGLFGSGVGELIETLRIVEFLKRYDKAKAITLPIEMVKLFTALGVADTYTARVNAREKYRESIRFGLSGEMESLDMSVIKTYLESLETLIKEGIETLYEENDGIIPTFITYEVTDYEALKKNGEPVIGHYGLPLALPKTFKRRNLPAFLEAPARLLKTGFDTKQLKLMYKKIKQSDIYDKALEMYKTSGDLDLETHEIGRIRAFTKGWLERESNFMHMTYKYLLGLLRAGLYEEYFEAINTNLVCFMDPQVYGRSTLENSSFIAPTNNPDPSIHGQGFFARLSGSTVEVVNMWHLMMAGEHPFKETNGELALKFTPKIHSKFFKSDKTLTFRFLKDIDITYVNESMESTYERCDIHKIELTGEKGTETINGDTISGNTAEAVRNGLFKSIKIYMNKN